MNRKLLQNVLLGVVVLFVLIQLVPYGHNHTNPVVSAEAPWSSPEAKAMFMQSCGDCHSNETKWPWYSNIAPISWRVVDHVEEGRSKFNVSEWGRPGENEGDKAAAEIEEGAMPLPDYLLMHPNARLNEEQKLQLISYLKATFGEEEKDEDER